MKKEQFLNYIKKAKYFYFVLVLVLLLGGTSFAFFTANFFGIKDNIIELKGLVFRYNELSQGINMTNALPKSDEEGKSQSNYFDFNTYIENDYNYAMTYNIYLKELIGNNIDPKYIKVYLTDQNDNQIVMPTSVSNLMKYPNDTDSYLLYTTTITPESNGNNTNNYRLRIWLDENFVDNDINYETNGNIQTGTILDRTFGFKVNVDNLTYEEDLVKPTITSVSATEGVTSSRKQIFVTASDNVGITGYLIKNNNETPTLDENWQTSTSLNFASSAIYGNGTYYVFVKDGNNNISNAATITISDVDISAPVCTFTGPDINNITMGEVSTMVLTCIDGDGENWQDSDITSSDIILSNSNIVQISEPIKEELTDRYGYKYTFKLTARNINGSTTLKAKRNIVLDHSGNGNKTTNESNSLTVLNLTKLKGAVIINSNDNYTASNNVNLTINTTGASKMCISESSNKDTDCGSGSSNWQDYATSKDYTLSSGDGYKAVYVYFDNDSVGSSSITLDTTPPTCNISQENENNWTKEKSITVSGSDAISGINPNGYSFDGTNYSSVVGKYITANGIYTAYVKDNIGNVGSCTTTVSKVDVTSPVISSASYTEVDGNSYLSYTASDGESGLSGYYVSNSNETPNPNDSSWVSTSNENVITNVIYNSSNAYYIFVKDNVGNVSAYFLVGRDSIPPTCMITATPEGKSSIKTLTITSNDTDLAEAPYSFDNSSYTTTNTKDITKNGVYTGYVKDEASNVGSCSITVTGLDTAAPNVVLTKTGGNGRATINATISDDSGVVGYAITTTNQTPTSWTTITSTTSTTPSFTKTSSGTYYVYAKDANDNIGYSQVSLSLSRNSSCSCQEYKQSCSETCRDTTCAEYDSCASCGCSSYGSYTATRSYCAAGDSSSGASCNAYGCYKTTCRASSSSTCSSYGNEATYCTDYTAYCQAYKSCSSCSCLRYNQSCTTTCHDTSTCETYSACWLS